jgi:hypothetical protein
MADNDGKGDDKPTLTTQLALSDDEFAALPEADRLITPDQRTEFNAVSTAREGAAVISHREGERERAAETERRQRDESAAKFEQDKDIRWADQIDSDEKSSDEAVVAAARTDRDANRRRYEDAVTARVLASKSKVRGEVLAEHFNGELVGLTNEGHGEFANNIATAVKANGNNFLLAALNEGKRVGDAEGYSRGKDEAERDARIQHGQDGAPDGANGRVSDSKGVDQYDLGKPGEARRMAVAAVEQGLRQN